MPDCTVVTHENPVLGVEKVVRVELDPSWGTIRYEDLTIIVLDDGVMGRTTGSGFLRISKQHFMRR
ncbi:hypothetical protein JYQ30_04330 [Curtobacterium flaccumfaciens pv. flaccumfaciens]|nr:hypothetical protein [Curtobacterium flaccumfaciens pv. flaccumfaciens]